MPGRKQGIVSFDSVDKIVRYDLSYIDNVGSVAVLTFLCLVGRMRPTRGCEEGIAHTRAFP